MSRLPNSDTWDTLFPDIFSGVDVGVPYDVNALLLAVTSVCTSNASVESVMLRTPFSMPQHRIFEGVYNGFGLSLRTVCGEFSYLRIRSYVKGSCFARRGFAEMIDGEIRELTLVTLDQDGRGRDGTVVILRFMLAAAAAAAAPPAAVVVVDTLDYKNSLTELSVLPLVLVDRHAAKPKKRKKFTYKGFDLLFFGAVEVVDNCRGSPGGGGVRNGPSCRSCCSYSTLELREWVLEVDQPTKYPVSSCMTTREHKAAYEIEKAKMSAKVNTHFQRRRDHPVLDEFGVQTASNAADVVRISRLFAECTTLGFALDLMASTTTDACHLPLFTDPCGFPLYLSVCVVLAATPSLMQQQCSRRLSDDDDDDDDAIAQVFDVYRSMTSGNTTILEMLVQLISEQLLDAPRNNDMHSSMQKPVSAEHMRKQGAVLCSELCSSPPTGITAAFNKTEASFCGAERYADALSVLNPSCIQRLNAENKRKSSSSAAADDVRRSTRCSTRCARLRRLLQVMVDVNEMLESGIYMMKREYVENTGEAASRHSSNNTQNTLLNLEAFNTASNTVRAYLVQGPLALLSGAGFTVFPIRHRTRATCGSCKEKFDFCTTAVNSRVSHCLACCKFYCNKCYNLKVCDIKNKTGTIFISSIQATEYRNAVLCSTCSPKA